MRLVLEKRAEHSLGMAILSPLIALALTVIAGGVIFALRGLDPFEALFVYFIEPLTEDWSSRAADHQGHPAGADRRRSGRLLHGQRLEYRVGC